ncbi:DUF6221 family protein [Streptomyces sp. SID2119]|uniref:DUF6221 family protein n=1 Tax=Streptomyces sp. SID2119 TaxID=2690253 RepID=UPI00136C8C4F|nr:DUF6221 family protein [Streptomyces sp. SID2119]MYW33615.1 hypothetical protein [Streptomyces sp. SID2119]
MSADQPIWAWRITEQADGHTRLAAGYTAADNAMDERDVADKIVKSAREEHPEFGHITLHLWPKVGALPESHPVAYESDRDPHGNDRTPPDAARFNYTAPPQPDTLVGFLRARFDDDTASATQWHDLECEIHTRLDSGLIAAIAVAQMLDEVPGAVCDCGGPTRVHQGVHSKRLLLEQAVASRHLFTGDQYMDCPLVTEADGAKADHVERIQALNDMRREELGREPTCIDTCGRDARVRRTLELLALPYSDHPDYKEAWRP